MIYAMFKKKLQRTQFLSPTNSLRNLTRISVLPTRNIHMTSTPLNMNREVYKRQEKMTQHAHT